MLASSSLSPGVLPSGEQLVDAPVLFLVLSHKAFSEELAQLYGLVVEAAEMGFLNKDCYFELNRRFKFLKLVYKYHCAAEDEVVFLALDAEVKNVAPTYSLEHKVIDDCFSSTRNVLNHLISDDTHKTEQLQELVCSIGALQESICQHMFKEEHQVFPLLMKKFSSEEQASLVWKYICSVPIKLLQEFLPWMTSLLTDYKMDLLGFLEFVVPKETLLQKVVISWIHPKDPFCSGIISGMHQEGHECYGVICSFKNILKQYPLVVQSKHERDFRTENSKHGPDGPNPTDGVCLWHSAIIKELLVILKELYQKTSSCTSALASIIVQLKFVLHILMFYSNVWDHILYPVIVELSPNGSSPRGQFFDKSQIEGLELLLYFKLEDLTQLSTYVEKICKELDSFIRRVNTCFSFLEREIFPFISDNCSCEALLWLFYSSLQMMPLGLLKQTIFWFSSHLSDEQFKAILNSIKLEYDAGSMSFISLLHDWVRMGYSGKIPIDKFRQDLKIMFNSRRYLLSEEARKGSSSSDKKSHVQELDNGGAFLSGSRSETRATNSMLHTSSPTSNITETDEIHYSSKMNRRVFFPQVLRKNPSIQNHHANSMSVNAFSDLESRPMDHVLLFHKALIKNLECLVNLSAKLAEDFSLLADFRRSFHLLQLIYQTHSESEDKIAFPALESIGKLQNISHAYVIDHNLEVEQFKKTSHILEEVTLFQSSPNAPSQRMQGYLLSCLKLHDACISMHKILSDHIYREEIELFPLFKQHFSIKEQEKIVAQMLGWTRAEILQEIIPWLVASIAPDEQKALISLWLKATRNTKFHEWLREWWVGMSNYDIVEDAGSHFLAESESCTLDVVLAYLSEGRIESKQNWKKHPQEQNSRDLIKQPGITSADKLHLNGEGDNTYQGQEPATLSSLVNEKRNTKTLDGSKDSEEVDKQVEELKTLMPAEHPLVMNQQELEDTIRRVSRDITLDPQKKAYIMQNLLMSRWIVTQQRFHEDNDERNDKEQIPGQCPSYQDSLGSVFGCNHYKRNCKLLAPCCNRLYTCIRCHDETTDHAVERKSITKMCCMKCLVIQPLNSKCSTLACNEFSMAKYFCKICKLFDDESLSVPVIPLSGLK
ncbi:hypothetical protein Leryth_001307 [Lithospermum erythrorhizon]|nr:hypothetical protein Leryth_001307 [Lithospermum erythrorhizon]